MPRRRDALGGEHGRERVERVRENGQRGRRGSAAQLAARAVGEDALQRLHPQAHRSVAERMCPRRVRGRHPADSAERAARWIDGELQADGARRAIDRVAERARTAPHRAPGDVDRLDFAEPAQIDDQAFADRAPRHAAPGPTRHEWRTRLGCPADERACIVGISGDRDAPWLDPFDPPGLAVNGAREEVVAVRPAKSRRRSRECHAFGSGGIFSG